MRLALLLATLLAMGGCGGSSGDGAALGTSGTTSGGAAGALAPSAVGGLIGGAVDQTRCAGSGGCAGKFMPASGTAAVLVTDAPTNSFTSVFVTITRVTLRRSDGAERQAFSGAREVDLLRLTGVHDLLAMVALPPGTYTQVTLRVASPRLVLLSGTEVTESTTPKVQLVGGGQATLTIPGGFTVAENGSSTLQLDFELSNAIRVMPQGDFTFDAQQIATKGLDGQAEVEDFEGSIQALACPTSLTVALEKNRGTVKVALTGNTVIRSAGGQNIACNALRVGEEVEVDGTLQGDTVTARRVLVEAAAEAEGTIASLNRATRTFTLTRQKASSLQVTFTGSTVIRFRDLRSLTENDLLDGQRVEVEGVLTGSTLSASVIKIKDEEFEGTASSRSVGAGVLSVAIDAGERIVQQGRLTGNPTDAEGKVLIDVLVDGGTEVKDEDEDGVPETTLAAVTPVPGQRVKVKGRLVAGAGRAELRATRLKLVKGDEEDEENEKEVKGTISNLASSTFTLTVEKGEKFFGSAGGGDTAGAITVSFTAATRIKKGPLANGQRVEVEGTLQTTSGGLVLQALKIKVKDGKKDKDKDKDDKKDKDKDKDDKKDKDKDKDDKKDD